MDESPDESEEIPALPGIPQSDANWLRTVLNSALMSLVLVSCVELLLVALICRLCCAVVGTRHFCAACFTSRF